MSTWKDLKAGDRVELVATTDPLTNMAAGTRGFMLADAKPAAKRGEPVSRGTTVWEEYTILSVRWDSGSWLQMIPELGDTIKKVDSEVVCPAPCGSEKVTPVDWHARQEGGWWKCDAGHEFRHQTMVLKGGS